MNVYVIVIIVLFVAWFFYTIYRRYKSVMNATNTPDSEKLIKLTDATFKKQIAKGVSLVDFWADWCTPCKIQGPIVSELADEMDGKAAICKLDVQHNEKISRELGIRNIPTIMIFKDGKMVQQFVGVKTKTILKKAVEKALN